PDHEFGGAGRAAVLGEQPRLLEQRAVGRRAHHGRRARDARHGLHRAGQTHQRDGIAIERGAHEVERGHRPPILHHHSTAQPRGAAGDGWPVTASRLSGLVIVLTLPVNEEEGHLSYLSQSAYPAKGTTV